MAKLVLMDGPTFVVSDESGDLAPEDSADGLYHHDTRFLSAFRLLLNGQPLAFLSAPQADSAAAIVHLTNHALRLDDGTDLLPQTISVRRTRFLRGGLHERIELTSYHRAPVPVRLGLRVAADFRDMFDVRGFARAEPGKLLRPRRLDAGIELRYRGRDGVLRTTRVVAEPALAIAEGVAWDVTVPAHAAVSLPDASRSVETPAQHVEEVELFLEGELRPQEPTVVTLLIEPCVEGDVDAAPPFEAGRETAEGHRREWLDRRVTRFGCSMPPLCRLLDRGADDLYMLTQWPPSGPVPVAGIPWFACPFGRDSIITAIAALPLAPDLAVGTLRFLAARQGTERNDWRDEEPGKIMHELRGGELANLGVIPQTPYYGSVDATPLFLVLLGAYVEQTGDAALARRLEPHARAAWSTTAGATPGTRSATPTAAWPRAR